MPNKAEDHQEQTPNEAKSPPSFLAFRKHIYRRIDEPKHLAYLHNYLSAIAERGDQQLIVSMPPRHGKSFTLSRLFPAWYLGIHPDHRVILASYGASLAIKNSRAVRNILNSPVYREQFPLIKLANDARSAESWDIAEHGGGMDAVGVGGGITGKGAHLLIVDDPVKSRAEAESAHMRDYLWEWFNSDLYTRREPHASIIIVMTRWHMDDLVGRLLRNQPDSWTYIRLPALAEANDPLNRAVGEALWEARFPVTALREIEANIGAYAFAGLYQQNPIPQAGGLFKRGSFNLIDVPPTDFLYRVRFWDFAMSEREHADYTAGVLMGMTTDERFVVLHVERFRAEWTDVLPRVIATARADGTNVIVGMEQVAYQSRAVQQFLSSEGMAGYAAFGQKPEGEKFVRALPFAARASQKLVDLVRGEWTDAFLDELVAFPQGAHDDQVDAAGGAYTKLVELHTLQQPRRALPVSTTKYT